VAGLGGGGARDTDGRRDRNSKLRVIWLESQRRTQTEQLDSSCRVQTGSTNRGWKKVTRRLFVVYLTTLPVAQSA
jgi:hypothetical protein